jgi:hypothetical protein
MSEEKKSIKEVSLILTRTADEFKKLHKEAKSVANRELTCEMLSQKAGLLVDLSSSLPLRVNGIKEGDWNEVLNQVRLFSKQAKEAFNSGETFALASLLMHPGDLNIDHNDLQKLTDKFKSEYVTSFIKENPV